MGSPVYFDRVTRQFSGLTVEVIARLKLLFPHVNINVEIMKMELWLDSEKGSNRKGSFQFITNWLSKTYTRPQESSEDPSFSPEQNNYLKDLWNNREHILSMNQRHA